MHRIAREYTAIAAVVYQALVRPKEQLTATILYYILYTAFRTIKTCVHRSKETRAVKAKSGGFN